MQVLNIKAREETPEVILNKEDGIFSIKGKSFPEDPFFFYNPILEWVKKYAENPNDKTELYFAITYFNTSSSKIILEIMKCFEIIKKEKNKEVLINWICHSEDEEMIESGEIYAERIDIPLNILADDEREY